MVSVVGSAQKRLSQINISFHEAKVNVLNDMCGVSITLAMRSIINGKAAYI